jgi:hypothetical protein
LVFPAGSKSIYDYQYAKNRKAGMTEEETKRRALVSAAIAFNETQQSALDEFLSPLQKSGSVFSRFVSTFMNNNFAYMRKQAEALTEMYRIAYAPTREALLQGTAKKYVKSGLSEDEAINKARRDLTKAFVNDLNREVIFGFALGMIWRYGMPAILSTMGDDDDDREKDMLLSLIIAPFDGTVMIGQIADTLRNGYEYSMSVLASELGKMYDSIAKIIKDDNLVSWDAVKLAGDILLRFRGLNLNSAYNIYEGIEGAIKDGLDANDIMTLLNMPKTEKRDYAAKIKEGESLVDYATRVAKAYDNEKMFQRYIGQYIIKYYFHDGNSDMTEFNRVIEKAKRWDKLRKDSPDSE